MQCSTAIILKNSPPAKSSDEKTTNENSLKESFCAQESRREAYKIINKIANVLSDCSKENKEFDIQFTLFSLLNTPSEPIRDYLYKLFYNEFTSNIFIVMLIYLSRYFEYEPKDFLHPRNIHRLAATALLLSTKYLEDDAYSNKEYTKISGISLQDLNEMEAHFFFKIHANLYVTKEEYNECKQFLTK